MSYSNSEIEQIKQEVDSVNELIWNYRNSPTPDYNPEALMVGLIEKAEAIGYKFGVARGILNKGMGAFILQNNIELALELMSKAKTLFDELNDEKWVSNTLLTKAIMVNSTGAPETALYDGLKGMEFYDKNPNDDDIPMAYYVIGTIYKDLNKFDQATFYYKKGIEVETNYSSWSGRLFTSLANIYSDQGKLNEALDLSLKSLEILKKANNAIGISRALNDIGLIYSKLGNKELALQHFLEALDYRKKANLKHFVLGSLIDIANLYLAYKDFDLANDYYEQAIVYANETNHLNRLAFIYKQQVIIFKELKNFEKTIEIYEKLVELNVKLVLQEKEAKISQSESKLLKEKEEEIERLRNIELKKAYEEIEQKNKDIQDSITYAKRIQYTLLAHQDFLSKNVPQHFVYFNPKDIVSGDFYWATKKNNLFYFAVCDSTGHGVPGAFMSLLNITFLNEAINEKGIVKPNEVFNFVRQRLIDNISKEGQKDGFDGILVCINQLTNEIVYAAANNSPILVSGNNFAELEFDKMPVGQAEKLDSFQLYKLNMDKKDTLYLYTDGFADQFGGPKGKKYMYKQLNQFLMNINANSLATQGELLKKEFEIWKGDLEQVDDVCIIGIRL